MKTRIHTGLGRISTTHEYSNSEMDTIVRFKKRVDECIESFGSDKPQYLDKDEYKKLSKFFKVLVGNYVDEDENAFEEAFSQE